MGATLPVSSMKNFHKQLLIYKGCNNCGLHNEKLYTQKKLKLANTDWCLLKIYKAWIQSMLTYLRVSMFTMQDSIIACIINNGNLFYSNTQDQSITSDIFGKTFTTYMDNYFKEFDQDFKT